MAEWATIEGGDVQAVLGVCGAITKYDLGKSMCLLVCTIVELDRRVAASGGRKDDRKLEEIIANMIRDHVYDQPIGETAGTA